MRGPYCAKTYIIIRRDLSRRPVFLICNRRMFRVAGTKYRSARLWLYLRYGLFDLQSADW